MKRKEKNKKKNKKKKKKMSACGTDADCNFPNGICNEGTCHCEGSFSGAACTQTAAVAMESLLRGGNIVLVILAVFLGATFGLIIKHVCSTVAGKGGFLGRAGHYGGGGDHHARAAARRARFEKERAKYRKLRGGKKSQNLE